MENKTTMTNANQMKDMVKNDTMKNTPEKTDDKAVKTKLTFDDQVIKKIAGLAVSEIPGILGLSGNAITNLTDKFTNGNNPTKGVSAEVGEKQVALDLDVIGEYGKNIAEVFDEAAQKVAESIKTMTGLTVVEFNMNVDDVLTREQYEDKYENKKKDDSDKEDKTEEKQEKKSRNLE